MRDVKLTRELMAAGLTATDLRILRRTGDLHHLRRGAYAPADSPPLVPTTGRDRHLELVRATLPQCSPEAVVSHSSAVAVHDLPWIGSFGDRVHLTRDRAGEGRTRRHVVVHGTPVDACEVVQLDDLRVSSMARTVVDVARTSSLVRGVAVGDGALRRGLGRRELEDAVAGARRRHGVGRARQMAGFVDPRSESAGESRSRLVLHEQGLPAPVPQYDVYDENGQWVARVDFCWEEQRTVGEFDGRIKYGRALAEGRDLEEVLFDEKIREDRLRDLGWQVVRWIWTDLDHPVALVQRLRRAFERGRR